MIDCVTLLTCIYFFRIKVFQVKEIIHVIFDECCMYSPATSESEKIITEHLINKLVGTPKNENILKML